jgi:hypothetical protein
MADWSPGHNLDEASFLLVTSVAAMGLEKITFSGM